MVNDLPVCSIGPIARTEPGLTLARDVQLVHVLLDGGNQVQTHRRPFPQARTAPTSTTTMNIRGIAPINGPHPARPPLTQRRVDVVRAGPAPTVRGRGLRTLASRLLAVAVLP